MTHQVYGPTDEVRIITEKSGSNRNGPCEIKRITSADGYTTFDVSDCFTVQQLSSQNPTKAAGDCPEDDGEIGVMDDSAKRGMAKRLGLASGTREYEWLFGERSTTEQQQINNLKIYLDENNITQATNYFGLEAFRAIMAGGDVDYVEKVIYDDSFLDTDIECIHNQLKNGDTFYKDMIEHFNDSNQQSHLIFEIGNVPAGDWGITSGDPDNANEFTITVGPHMEDKSNLAKIVTMSHELIHAYMFDFLEDAGLITFDLDGAPLLNVDDLQCDDGINYNGINLNSLTTEERFVALLCTMEQNGTLGNNFTHDLFNVPTFEITDYREALEQLILNKNDWVNENPSLILLLQNEFGNDWKAKAAEYLSWKGLEKTSAFANWASANNVDYVINNDGNIGGSYNGIVSSMDSFGNSTCN